MQILSFDMNMPYLIKRYSDKTYKTQTLDSCTLIYKPCEHFGFRDFFNDDTKEYLLSPTEFIRKDLLTGLVDRDITYIEYGDSRTNVKCRVYYDKYGNIVRKYTQPISKCCFVNPSD